MCVLNFTASHHHLCSIKYKASYSSSSRCTTIMTSSKIKPEFLMSTLHFKQLIEDRLLRLLTWSFLMDPILTSMSSRAMFPET
ncbi:unnamed protein product, partial [Schistosoma haematobium]